MRKIYHIEWADRRLELGRRTCIMGIVNVTPDSFSDGGRFLNHEAAVAQGIRLAAEGADILDIGGESTRPFSDPVSTETELSRVIPVIEALAPQLSIPISVDTMKAAVAREAIAAGAAMVNDISALRHDPQMGDTVARAGVPLILMHMLGTPKTMQQAPHYDDLFGEISAFLATAMDRARSAGVPANRLIIDPGIGFGKTVSHNLDLIRGVKRLAALDAPVLIGPSRKAFIRRLLSDDPETPLSPDDPAVAHGTLAAATAAILSGAHLIRVHEVASARAAARIADALLVQPQA
ncbi:MAG TPA: dihydropteroate synthase [Desulfobacteraceae bacterium]|nr:dihydropteroate synthase [Deltaproteobacteria bacterium]HDI61147.1 dihydropteroate synthase [Desulfobacteraceae bacterium]